MSSLSQFFMGAPGRFDQRSTLGPDQQGILSNLTNSIQNPGAGGAFGTSADYYRNLLSDNPSDLQAMAAPEMRRFNQQTIPGLANQFAGIGAGGATSGSGFRNALGSASTDLLERIASLRAGLRQQGAAGLSGLGQQGLGSYYANTYQPRTPGLFESFAPAIGQAAGAGLSGGTSGLLSYLAKLFQNSNTNTGVEQ